MVAPKKGDKEMASWGQAQHEPQSVSGNASAVAGARLLPSTSSMLDVVRGQWQTSRPRTLILGTMPSPWVDGSAFPPATPIPRDGASYDSGILTDAGVDGGDWYLYMACVLEYGHGAAAQRAYFDWRPGAYNLPSCSYVNVQALPWGSGWSGTAPGIVAASIVPGQVQGAHVPTATGYTTLPNGNAKAFGSPDHARGFDIEFAGDPAGGVPNVQVQGGAYGLRDFAGLYVPGWSPLAVTPRTAVQLTKLSGPSSLLRLRWYLQL